MSEGGIGTCCIQNPLLKMLPCMWVLQKGGGACACMQCHRGCEYVASTQTCKQVCHQTHLFLKALH